MSTRTAKTMVRRITFLAIILGTAGLTGCATRKAAAPGAAGPAATLPDVSGLAWIEGDLFLAVHDAKRSKKQRDWPRVSLVRLPRAPNEGVVWQMLDLEFPGDAGPANDLESAARIPGGRGFLFAESGPRGKAAGRIFHAVYASGGLSIESSTPWPEEVENVEAIGVGEVGGRLVFIYAERAEGLLSTEIRWAELSLEPLEFGEFQGATYIGADPVGERVRLVSALAVDSGGVIYSASAYDPRDDGGPFRSVVWRIGKVAAGEDGNPRIELAEGERVATLDGLKVEGIAWRESAEGGGELYVGTDDENYGGIIRPLSPLRPAIKRNSPYPAAAGSRQ